ncbi:MAG: bifunctional 4-hydroxy-2-oxoglutarate aldolase/2-dehydro-3-deoxy-phosphogluconate aldolase [Oscillospiraceae bacterium]|nr:bifunctional 4-hydroxy-2-oxoglutarate aldolase/2-dehydro-3-deoxy-phosphogluconate aldolase [Oscillospiraceae bacterium]
MSASADIFQKIKQTRVIPVVTINNTGDALPLAKALCDGGLPCAEITFRTQAAEESMRLIAAEYPQMLIGAGTILTPEQADKAKAAGAKFIVSPGLNPRVVEHCRSIGVPMIPGCMTPSDIERAIELGLSTVKFFPAEAAGGLKMLKALSAPYPNIEFMPTGGITDKNITEYLSFNKVIACGGSFMVSNELIAAGDFSKITELTAKSVEVCKV